MTTPNILTVLAILAPAAAAADLPKPIADLEHLVGTWKGAGTVTLGKDRAKIDLAWTCKRTSGRHGVLCTLVLTGIPGLPKYEETDLFGYEANTNTYHWFSVTNGGETHDHVAQVPKGKTIQFVFEGTQEGKPLKEVIDMDFAKDGKTLAIRSETFVGGVPTAVLDVKAKK